jgi:hypothetical protein
MRIVRLLIAIAIAVSSLDGRSMTICGTLLRSTGFNAADVSLGRRGDEFVAAVVDGHWLRVPDDQMLEPKWGFTSTGQKLYIPSGSELWLANELMAWSHNRSLRPYHDWNWRAVVPFKARAAVRLETDSLDQTRDPFGQKIVFRRLFEYYLRRVVSLGGKIFIRLHAEDEALLRELNALPEDERKLQVEEKIKSYFENPEQGEAPMTRLELLTVCRDSRLFAASLFFRRSDGSNPVSDFDRKKFWLGSLSIQ